MKKSELHQVIREEIQVILNENKYAVDSGEVKKLDDLKKKFISTLSNNLKKDKSFITRLEVLMGECYVLGEIYESSRL